MTNITNTTNAAVLVAIDVAKRRNDVLFALCFLGGCQPRHYGKREYIQGKIRMLYQIRSIQCRL